MGSPDSLRARTALSGGEAVSQTDVCPTRGSPKLLPGALLGRYRVLHRIGAGAMGVVYAARDEELHRTVALKVLRPRRRNTRAAEMAARLHREAQAMARVSHRNVVAVRDVGAALHEGERLVFVAMEYVDGGTLRQWLRQQARRVEEILPLFIAAGKGLAAAHDRGLVHRDFKPDNVLVGKTGSVRVTDFGLARIDDTAESVCLDLDLELDGADVPLDLDLAEASVTRTGSLLGTPAYMAPEQFRLGAVDHRTDQFAFCIALYEALFGQRPFRGTTTGQLAASVTAGRLRRPPPGSGVPAWIKRIVWRGLSRDPRKRYPSMAALVADLERGGRKVRRWTALAGAAAAVLTTVYATYAVAETKPACVDGVRQIGAVWNADRRGAVERVIARSEAPDIERRWQGAATTLDAQRDRWVRSYEHACAAGPSPRTDRALACLADRRRQLTAVVSLLSEAGPADVSDLLYATWGMQRPETCLEL